MGIFHKRELGSQADGVFREAGARRVNPETIITRQIRELLRILRIQHLKHWGGPMSEPGVSDIIGTMPPNGRSLYVEIKAGKGRPSDKQIVFLERMRNAGALAFAAWGPDDILRELRAAGYAPAFRISLHGEPLPDPQPKKPEGEQPNE